MTLTVRATSGYALARPPGTLNVRSVAGYALVNPNPRTLTPAPVPTDTRQVQTAMLYDLIEKSNPGFKVSYPVGSVVFGVPSAIAVNPNDPYQNDTTVRVTPAPNTTGMGVVSVNYRRIDLAKRFQSMKLMLTDWSAGTSIPTATWLPLVAAKYGLSITVDDQQSLTGIVNNNFTTMQMKAACLCYKGSVPVYWTKTLQPLNTILTDANRALVGRLYPSGNDFTTPGRKPQGEFLAFCQDATSVAAILETMPASVNPVGTAAYVTAIIDFLLANTVRTDWNAGATTISGGLISAVWYKYSLPNVAIPEANSAKYNRCIVIQSAAGSWFAGKIIIHYNV